MTKFRRWLAGKILGNDTAFFASKHTIELMRQDHFMLLPDEALGGMFRRFWAVFCEFNHDESEREGWAFDAQMRSACILYLASSMRRIGADSADYTVSGSIDGGKTEGAWAVRIETDPNHVFGGNEVIARDDKITSLTVSFGNPGYEAWRKANADGLTPTTESPTQ